MPSRDRRRPSRSIFRQTDVLFAVLRDAPLDFRLLGKTLLHAALVGLAAGLVGVCFFLVLERVQDVLLGDLAGYQPLRASGEPDGHASRDVWNPWLLVVLPALGGLLSGAIAHRFAPEIAGGGGDAAIRAFHHDEGRIRPRVIATKAIASVATLGAGGSGGREGPTMQIGGAIGSLVADLLRVGKAERRILLVAGMAAGIAAVFRTPLGAALLAVEILYRDDFEAEALVPAVLASVVGYSVVITILGESTLFAHAPRYPFVPAHLPLYALLALVVAVAAAGFVATLRAVQRTTEGLAVPRWLRPALGGLLLGGGYVALRFVYADRLPAPGQGLGILGGSYGAAQIAITGASWLPQGWGAVELLLVLALAKIAATALTVGSGGSAGDFAPSLVIGGLVGGAFGHAVSLLSEDPRLDPGAFALVGMGAFYGGIANVPLAALVLVCELAGSYDLLVPSMLAQGIAIAALRTRSLYEAQPRARRDSPAHGIDSDEVFSATSVGTMIGETREIITFTPETPGAELVRLCARNESQDVYPVLDRSQVMVGIVTADTIRLVAAEPDAAPLVVAAELMTDAVSVQANTDLRAAAMKMLELGLRELPVTDGTGRLVGLLDEAEIARRYVSGGRKSS